MAELKTKIIIRNDSSDKWESVKDTAVLLKGEIGIEFLADGKTKTKIGDGVKTWAELPYFGGEEAFEKRVINDNIKNDFCMKNNINLIRLPYNLTEQQIKDKIIHIWNP